MSVNLAVERAPALPMRSSADGHKLAYRADVDGLRAIAIVAVVAYHAFPSALPGGFVGVDIFFVISGFLITRIIFEGLQEGSFTFWKFYSRRIRRIFPSLVIVIAATLMLGWHFMQMTDFASLGSNILGGAFFSQNFVLISQVAYFDIAAEKKPLLHLWSLGIEEQYYIVWPILLVAFRRRPFLALTATAVLGVISFIACVIMSTVSPEAAFYTPQSRAWELLVGSSLALAQFCADGRFGLLHRVLEPYIGAASSPLSRVRGEIVALSGLLMIGYATTHFGPATPYPSYRALLPVFGCALMIVASESFVNKRLLSWRPIVAIGLISYPLYLWHYPLLAFVRVVWADSLPRTAVVAVIAVSFILAWACYQCVEQPIRRLKGQRYRAAIAGLVGGIVCLGAFGYIVSATDGLPIRYPVALRPFLLTGKESSRFWREGKCLLLPDQGPSSFAPDCAGNGRRPLIFIWGDSYGAALFTGLDKLSAAKGYSVAEYTSSACPPILGFVHPERRFCKANNDYIFSQIAALRPQVLVLHCTWRYSDQDLEKGLRETIPKLKALGIKKIVLLGPVPTWDGAGLSANVVDNYYATNPHELIGERTFFRSQEKWTVREEGWLLRQAEAFSIDYISPHAVMCNNAGCLARIGANGSDLTAFDTGHMTVAGSTYLAKAILPLLLGNQPN